jgi:hypothetical protein
MRKPVAIAFTAVLALGILAVVLAGLTNRSDRVQSLGVLPVSPVAPISAGQEVCQSSIALAEPLRRVRFNIGTQGKPGPALDVTVREPNTRAVLGRGAVKPGWIDNGTPQEVTTGEIPAERYVAVCIRNRGPVRAYVFGEVSHGQLGTGPVGVSPTVSTSSAEIDGQAIAGDLSMSFVSERPRSALSLVPAMFRRASVFRPEFVGPWTYWLLLVAVLVLAPLMLWRAVRTAIAAEPAGTEPTTEHAAPRPAEPRVRERV